MFGNSKGQTEDNTERICEEACIYDNVAAIDISISSEWRAKDKSEHDKEGI